MIRIVHPGLLALVLVCACGGGDDDGGDLDAALGADSSEVLADAAASTACGGDEAALECDRATEICVAVDTGGGGPTYACAALPGGCAATRNCATCAAACEAPADTCDDSAQDNTLSCSCLSC